jgi:predicted nucleic acid-binding protein
MMILADTSIWIDHLRRADPRLETAIEDASLLVHSAVIGELACGTLPKRSDFLHYLQDLPAATMADAEETLFVIESRKLWGKGIGWTDAQLIASALLSGCKLWSHDKQLQNVATSLGIAY